MIRIFRGQGCRFAALAGLAIAGLLFPGCKPKAGGPTAFPPVQVVVIEAPLQTVAETLSLVGSVLANEMVEIKPEMEGVVSKILFQEGQQVTQGQLLLQLDDTKLSAALAEAEANFKLSQTTHARSQQLFAEKLVSQQEFDQAASAFEFNRASLELKKRQLKDTRVNAPFEGVVGARNVSPGQVIQREKTLTWLVDLDPVKVEVYVPEKFLSQLKIGQNIEFGVAAYQNQKFKGQLYFIAPQVDPNDRTALIKALLPNPDFRLKPGMFANLDLTLTIRENAVVVPEVALVQALDGEQGMIFAVGADQTVQPRKVRLGVRLAGQVEVLQGLTAGEKVIVEGTQKVGPGSKVTFAPAESAQRYLVGPAAQKLTNTVAR